MQHPSVKTRPLNLLARFATLASFSAVTPPAFAHHAEWMSDSPALQGLSMPVHGLDHLLLSLTVGFLCVKLAGGRGLAILAIHVVGLLLGALVNFAGSESPALTYGIPILAATVAASLMLRKKLTPNALIACAVITLLAGLCNAGAMVASVRDAGGATSGIFLGATLVSCAIVTALGAILGTLVDVESGSRRSTITALVILALTAASAFSPDLNEAIIRFLEN